MCNTMLSIQNDPKGDHAYHEGLTVLVMNLLKSKKVDKPYYSKKVWSVSLRGVNKMRDLMRI